MDAIALVYLHILLANNTPLYAYLTSYLSILQVRGTTVKPWFVYNSFWKHAYNLKHLYIEANFPLRNVENSGDSFHDTKIFT